MRSRAVRITLTLLALAAIGTAAYFSWTIQTRTRAAQQAAATLDLTRITALRDAYELRATQQAYVAAGQSETFWFGEVTEAIESLRAATATLRSSTTSPTVLAAVEEAAAAIESFEQVDRRARGYATSGQKLLASDVIFSDGFEAASRITTALEKAGFELDQSTQKATSDGTRQQAMAVGGAAAFALFALLLLMPVAATPAVAPAAVVQEAAFGDTLRLREDVKAPERRPSANRDPRDGQRRKTAASPAPAAGAGGTTPRPAAPAASPSVELQGLAAVCTDLSRLSDTSLLPGILERASAALDASGLVVWIADQDGRALVPIATHGYAASVVSRMGSLKVDGENATAAAFRTGLVQTVSAGPNSTGAIAVPLLSPAGCRGVMSAEVRHDGQKQPGRLAAASIIAAQLATLVGPPAAQSADDRTSAAL